MIGSDAESARRERSVETGGAAILSLGTAVPGYESDQSQILEWMTAAFEGRPATQRLLRSIYEYSGIETRAACCPDYQRPVSESRLAPGRPRHQVLTTAERMTIYEREAPALGVAAARRACESYALRTGVPVNEAITSVTHLIVVTCTGFFAPGLDFVLARELGLQHAVARTVIGFMGCAAAFNGMRAASDIVRGDANARVLVVCVELCSLHIQPSASRDDLVAASLFADGAAACVIGDAAADGALFKLEGFHSVVKPETRSRMIWQIGDHGFRLHLSAKIPGDLSAAAPGALRDLCVERPAFWAIHPGGRAILDKLAEIFALTAEDVAPSREVLRGHGNLSSATILFVLDEMSRRLAARRSSTPPNGRSVDEHAKQASGVMMAFGPGLVIEMARVTWLGSLTARHLAGATTDEGARAR